MLLRLNHTSCRISWILNRLDCSGQRCATNDHFLQTVILLNSHIVLTLPYPVLASIIHCLVRRRLDPAPHIVLTALDTPTHCHVIICVLALVSFALAICPNHLTFPVFSIFSRVSYLQNGLCLHGEIHPQQSYVANHTNTRSYSQYNVYTCIFCTRVDLAMDSFIPCFALAVIRPIDCVDTCSFMQTNGTIAQYAICGKENEHEYYLNRLTFLSTKYLRNRCS